MATPLNPTKALSAFRKFGLTIVEHGEWRTHNRNHVGRWGPVHGVMLHHTVTRGTQQSLSILKNGYAGLPGPLCHGMIDKDGTVYLVGWGRANHAGLGDSSVLDAVIDERKVPRATANVVDGNPRFYGFECVNLGDGKDPWPEEQIEAMCRASAALCDAHGWSSASVVGHLEWQFGKIDPRGLSMTWMRSRVDKLLKSGPPKPVEEVSLSRLVKAARTDPGALGSKVTYAGVKTVEKALADEGLLEKALVDGHYGTLTVEAYAKWQKKLGYEGKDADGIPGASSLKKLADKYGFTVV